MAGVTLLSFGNGAPDLFSAFKAAQKSEAGFYMAICSLIGAALFCIGVTLSLVILIVKKPV